MVHAQNLIVPVPLVPYACTERSSMNFEPVPFITGATPLIASSSNNVCNGDVLALLERCYQTTDRYDKEQTSPLASLEAQWLVPAPA